MQMLLLVAAYVLENRAPVMERATAGVIASEGDSHSFTVVLPKGAHMLSKQTNAQSFFQRLQSFLCTQRVNSCNYFSRHPASVTVS